MFSKLNDPDRITGTSAAAINTRKFDWCNTSLGVICSWPISLISNVNLVLGSPVPMALWWGKDLNQIYNEAYRQSLGKLPKHPGLGENPLDFWSEFGFSWHSHVERSLKGTSSKFDLYISSEDSFLNSIWTFSMSPVYDETNSISGVLLICQKSNQVLPEQEDQLNQVVESSPIPLAIYTGPEMIIKFANKAIIEAYGKGDDVIGKSFFEVLPELKTQEAFDQIRQVFRTGVPFHAKYRKLELIIQGKRQAFYFNYSYTPIINSEGEIYGILNTGVDVTDLAIARNKLEESEERFRKMADGLPIIIWSTDSDGKLNYMNKFGLNLFGESLESLQYKDWMQVFHFENREKLFNELIEAVQNSKPFRMEIRILKNDGEVRWLLIQGAPIYFSDGELLGYVGSSLDITERKEAEEKLEKKNKQLTRINNDLDNFVYTASHDLRAPMSNIEGLLESLKDTLQIDGHKYSRETELILDMMKKSIDQFKNTIQDLTEITKTQKEPHVDIGKVYFEKVVDEVKVSLSGLLESSQAEIITDFEVVDSIRFSKKNLKSIIYNLTGNAVKYRHRGRKPKVVLRTTKTKEHILLIVQDNGLGINEENYSKIFEMFKRLHAHEEGTGIGLYIVKRILDNVGGKIEVTSEVGVGTEFKVYFKRT